MSYGFDLVRLAPAADLDEEASAKAERMRATLEAMADQDVPRSSDPSREQRMQELAAALMSRHPTLERHPSSFGDADSGRPRVIELNERSCWIQIHLFDDGAGASFSFVGDAQACTRALRLLWDCLEILESEAGYSTYDPQIGKVLNLESDFETVLKYACGVKPAGRS